MLEHESIDGHPSVSRCAFGTSAGRFYGTYPTTSEVASGSDSACRDATQTEHVANVPGDFASGFDDDKDASQFACSHPSATECDHGVCDCTCCESKDASKYGR